RPGAAAVAARNCRAAAELAEIHGDTADAGVVVAARGVVPGGGDGVADLVDAASAACAGDADVGVGDGGRCRYDGVVDDDVVHRMPGAGAAAVPPRRNKHPHVVYVVEVTAQRDGHREKGKVVTSEVHRRHLRAVPVANHRVREARSFAPIEVVERHQPE